MNLCGIELATPLMNAAGTLWPEAIPGDVYGALIPKTVTLEARVGNAPPRLAEVPGGMINSIGLENPGIYGFLEGLCDWASTGLPVIVSIGGSRPRDFPQLCEMLAADPRIAGIELNLSCPNNYDLGASFCASPESIEIIVEECAFELRGSGKPLIAKLGFEYAAGNATWAADAGADAVTLINTVPALTFMDGGPMRGGLSGPGLKYIALRAVYEAAQVVDVPLIGVGGITSGQDVKEFMDAGATAVQIGSGSFVREPSRILEEYYACA